MKHNTSELTGAPPVTAMQMLARSPEADRIHFAALRAVDDLALRWYEGRMPESEAGYAYRQHVAALSIHAMRQELLPIDAQLSRLTLMLPAFEAPPISPEVQAWRDSIFAKWEAVAHELLVRR